MPNKLTCPQSFEYANPVETFSIFEGIVRATLLAAAASVKIAKRRVRRERINGLP
jgi:hypothetical protein